MTTTAARFAHLSGPQRREIYLAIDAALDSDTHRITITRLARRFGVPRKTIIEAAYHASDVAAQRHYHS